MLWLQCGPVQWGSHCLFTPLMVLSVLSTLPVFVPGANASRWSLWPSLEARVLHIPASGLQTVKGCSGILAMCAGPGWGCAGGLAPAGFWKASSLGEGSGCLFTGLLTTVSSSFPF